jgi:serine protease Do
MTSRKETIHSVLGLGLALGFAIAIAVGAMAEKRADVPSPTEPVLRPVQVQNEPADPVRRSPIVQAVERVKPAVVSITTETGPSALFHRGRHVSQDSSDGSGVVIDQRGIVLTNAHVVERTSRITITLADGRSAEASVLGVAPSLDLAVLAIAGIEGLTAVEVGSSEDLMLGETVIAIGNPFGLGHTVTVGVVSATKRPLATDSRVYQDFIQTDASINPGNSGGPLLDIRGRLVGITTSVHRDGQGIGFAIPADRALKVAHDLMETGQVQMPWLGITLEDVLLRDQPDRTQAMQVKRVIPGGPGAEAGLRTGDILTSVDDRPVIGRADLNTYLAGLDAGATVRMTVQSEGSERAVVLTSAKIDAEMTRLTLENVLGGSFIIRGTTPNSGVILNRVHRRGSLGRIGLRAGDVIRAVDGRPVRTIEQLVEAIRLALSRHRPTALFDVRRARARGRVAVPI